MDREETIRKHLFHVGKLLLKAFKKTKILATRSTIQRLKKSSDDGAKRSSLEQRLMALKTLKSPPPECLMHVFSLLWDEDIRAQCRAPEASVGLDSLQEEVVQHKSFQKELSHQHVRLQGFLARLSGAGEKKADAKKKANPKPRGAKAAPSGPAKRNDAVKSFKLRSFFMSSLSNQTEDTMMARRPKRTVDSLDPSAAKKKNRPGQRARRQMAQGPAAPRETAKRRKSEKPAEESLHPSWQAALQQKTRVSKALRSVSRQYIVFGDGDEE